MGVVVINNLGFILGEIGIFLGIALTALAIIRFIAGIVRHEPWRKTMLYGVAILLGIVIWFFGYVTAKTSLKYVPFETPKGVGLTSILYLLAEKMFFAPIGDRIAMFIGVTGFILGFASLSLVIGNILYSYLVLKEIPSEWVDLLRDWAFLFSAGAMIGLGFQIIHYVYSGYPVMFSEILLQTPYAPLFIGALVLMGPLMLYVSYKLYQVLVA